MQKLGKKQFKDSKILIFDQSSKVSKIRRAKLKRFSRITSINSVILPANFEINI